MLLVISIPAFHDFMASIVGDMVFFVLDTLYPATMGLVALFAVVGVSNSLANEEGVEPLPAVATSMPIFLLPPNG